jgi:hypothetical protein
MKIKRDAFLYLAPESTQEDRDFAQCGSCRLFVPGKDHGLCVIHGSKVNIGADDSCGFFVPWATPDGKPKKEVVDTHAGELSKGLPASVTPEESGLVDRLVQCHRCRFAADAAATKCSLYADLNEKFPEAFDLDTAIEPHACCNAQIPF